MPKPPSKNRKGQAPLESQVTSDSLDSIDPTYTSSEEEIRYKWITFRVPFKFYREFKGYAFEKEMSMVDLFYEMYKHYRKSETK